MYDVTNFLENHPGGSGIILQNAGKDVTSVYPSLVENPTEAGAEKSGNPSTPQMRWNSSTRKPTWVL